MTVSTGLSLLASTTSQTNRLLDLTKNMDDLQRQSTTGKKYDTFEGFGTDAYQLQNLRVSINQLNSYKANTTAAESNLNQMSTIMSEIAGIGSDLKSAISSASIDATGISNLATSASSYLDYLQSLLNETGTDGTYLFSGSNTTQASFIDQSGLNTNYSNLMTDWYNGTITSDQLATSSNSLSSSQLGLNPVLDTNNTRKVTVDSSISIEYSAKANMSGIQDLMRSLSVIANLKYPDGTTTTTVSDMKKVLDYASNLALTGTADVQSTTAKLSSTYSTLKNLSEKQDSDLTLYQGQVDKTENADTTEAVIKLNTLQTQIEAAYQVTASVSKLSLVNYIS